MKPRSPLNLRREACANVFRIETYPLAVTETQRAVEAALETNEKQTEQ